MKLLTSRTNTRRSWVAGFTVVGTVMALCSAAFACTVYMGSMTVSGNGTRTNLGADGPDLGTLPDCIDQVRLANCNPPVGDPGASETVTVVGLNAFQPVHGIPPTLQIAGMFYCPGYPSGTNTTGTGWREAKTKRSTGTVTGTVTINVDKSWDPTCPGKFPATGTVEDGYTYAYEVNFNNGNGCCRPTNFVNVNGSWQGRQVFAFDCMVENNALNNSSTNTGYRPPSDAKSYMTKKIGTMVINAAGQGSGTYNIQGSTLDQLTPSDESAVCVSATDNSVGLQAPISVVI